MTKLRYFLFACLCCALPAAAATPGEVLDEFHQAAARADLDGYFGLMTENVVFLGTDGTERWQGQEFRDFVTPHFESGRGWEYVPTERHILYSEDGQSAWFDEALRHEELGRCRGSGVLVQEGGAWKVAQYNLSVPIPNELVMAVVGQIQSSEVEAGEPLSEPVSAVAEEPDEKSVRCRKKRHKTNKPAGC